MDWEYDSYDLVESKIEPHEWMFSRFECKLEIRWKVDLVDRTMSAILATTRRRLLLRKMREQMNTIFDPYEDIWAFDEDYAHRPRLFFMKRAHMIIFKLSHQKLLTSPPQPY